MSRNNNQTARLDAFFQEFRSFTHEFDRIDKVFKQEQKRGSVSKGTCQSFENLYNKSHLREKYILALAELDTRLTQSRRPEKNQYLAIVRSQLDRLHRKDSINKHLRNTQNWLNATETESLSNQRNRIRKNSKGGIDDIRQKLIKTLIQAKDLNKSAIGNKYIGDRLEEINRKVISSTKSHLYAKIAGVGITSITASLLEHYENLIGNNVKNLKINGDRPFSDESTDTSLDQPELSTGDSSSYSVQSSNVDTSSSEPVDATFEFDSSQISGNSSSASEVNTPEYSTQSSGSSPQSSSSEGDGELGDSPGGDEYDTEMIEVITSNVSLSVWYYVLIIAIALTIAYIAYQLAEEHEKGSKNSIIEHNIDGALAENLDKKIDSKTTKYKEKVDELEKIQEFLDKGR